MKNLRKIIPFILIMTLTCASLPMAAQADSSKVVTLGANLSEEQKTSMYEYFGTSADQVETIEVTNADEREYMEGIATEAQIGTRTYSCSYVEPTSSGGIQVKVANLTFVTSSMIASTLLTSGMENCNVVAASPIEVSGTGALTGIMMAYETASGEELSEEQKEAAVEELVTTGDLADSVGQEEASQLMNDVKQDVIENGLTDEGDIQNSVQDAADRAWESNRGKPAELNIPIQTMGWSYFTSPRQRQKSKEEVLELLNTCAKMNANLLLNIGPRPDGTILEENVKTLKEVGEYLDKHGFPQLNTKDYMKYRTNATLKADDAKENQTAR